MNNIKESKLYNKHQPRKSNICAVIITFNPDLDIYQRVQAIRNQVNEVIIVDNGSVNINIINELTNIENIRVINNNQNLGIATALNQGAFYAKDKGYKWLLTLDQDTHVYSHLVENLIRTYNDYPKKNELALIACNYQDKKINKPSVYQFPNKSSWVEVDEVICSGGLMYLPIFFHLGCFKEELFIDQVDNDYCFRVKDQGYQIVMSNFIGMVHSMGDIRTLKLFNKTFYTYNQSPIRSYYRTRNSILLIKRYKLQNPKWAINKSISILKDLVKIFLFEEFKLSKVGYMLLGVYHAITKKSGRLS